MERKADTWLKAVEGEIEEAGRTSCFGASLSRKDCRVSRAHHKQLGANLEPGRLPGPDLWALPVSLPAGDMGSVGDFAAGSEMAFCTILQRSYAVLGARMHYGHPDLMNKQLLA